MIQVEMIKVSLIQKRLNSELTIPDGSNRKRQSSFSNKN